MLAFLLDFAKAFDKVPHQRLVSKLLRHGIDGKVCAWITEWLRGRSQRVCLLGVSMGTRASGYPLSNGYPGSKISARVGTVGPPVVINTSRLAKISAAVKSCTPVVVVALLSATEAIVI